MTGNNFTTMKELSKNVLIALEKKNLPTTPENYFKEFKEQSEHLKKDIEEISLFKSLCNHLTPNEKAYIKAESFSDLANIFSQRVNEEQLKDLLNIFEDVLSPSVDFSNKDEMEKFVRELFSDPVRIVEKDVINKIKDIADQRVTADRAVLRKKTDDIIKISSLMGKYFEKSLLESNNSTGEITKIKNELTELNISNSSHRELGMLQSKLIDTIFNIEHSMEKNHATLDANKQKFEELHKTIEALQKELSLAKKEKSTDFLTDILNRRAYEEEVEKIEKKHNIFDAKYAIVFIDIDHFKDINDTYGHNCGDIVLKSFAKILKGLTRQEDVLARYGGEEFISLINYNDEKEISQYIIRLKKIISNNYFVYKDIKLNIKFSAGITLRKDHQTYGEAKKCADQLLYKAKQEGRNKIIFENGTEY